VIGQAPIPTPEIALEPMLPELALCLFAIVGLLYEALARRSDPLVHLVIGLVGVALAAATSLWLWDWDGETTVLAGALAVDRFGVLARLPCWSSPRSASSWGISTSAARATSRRGSSHRCCCWPRSG
jgi:NADH:ubiquinone oxidoreductase subunit 2 (subunit N)